MNPFEKSIDLLAFSSISLLFTYLFIIFIYATDWIMNRLEYANDVLLLKTIRNCNTDPVPELAKKISMNQFK